MENEDCLFLIFLQLDYNSLMNTYYSCKKYKKIIDINENDIYKNLIKKDFNFEEKNVNYTWKQFYYYCKNLNIEGKWEITNKIYNPQLDEYLKLNSYMAIVNCEKNKFTANSDIPFEIFEMKDLKCKIIGELDKQNKMRITGHIILSVNNKKIETSSYNGFLQIENLNNKELICNFTYKTSDNSEEVLTGITIGKRII